MILETDYGFRMRQAAGLAKYISSEKDVFSCEVLSIIKKTKGKRNKEMGRYK